MGGFLDLEEQITPRVLGRKIHRLRSGQDSWQKYVESRQEFATAVVLDLNLLTPGSPLPPER